MDENKPVALYIACSNPEAHPSRQIWRLTYDGRILGDSRGYDRKGAKIAAETLQASNPGRFYLTRPI